MFFGSVFEFCPGWSGSLAHLSLLSIIKSVFEIVKNSSLVFSVMTLIESSGELMNIFFIV